MPANLCDVGTCKWEGKRALATCADCGRAVCGAHSYSDGRARVCPPCEARRPVRLRYRITPEEKRARRLAEGRCPTHGIAMVPHASAEPFYYECPRADCAETARIEE